MKTTLITSILILLSGISPRSEAQDLDVQRMNRDIRIMENVLEELFKMEFETEINNGDRAVVISGFSPFGRGVKGTYLPGYGALFMVSSNTSLLSSHVNIVRRNKDKGGAAFYYGDGDGDDDSNRKIDEETIKERITEFLKNYAPTIGQLKKDEQVMVIYGSNSGNSQMHIVVTRNENGERDVKKEERQPSVISVSVKKSDLDAYRRGSLKENEFGKKLSVSNSENKERVDLKVMSNIFETAFKESRKNALRISGTVNFMYLENFGALFSFNARFSNRDFFAPFDVQRLDVRRLLTEDRDSAIITAEKEAEKRSEERTEQTKEAYETFKKELQEYLIDYGRTLSSVDSDQHILVSVDLNTAWSDNELPERLDIQLKKSVLEDVDKGAISREQAMKKIVLTEY